MSRARINALAVLFSVLSLLLVSSALGGRFDHLGETRIATVVPECREVDGYDVSPEGNAVLYYGSPTGPDSTRIGVWLNTKLVARCDSVLEFGFAASGKPYFVAADYGREFVYFAGKRSRGFERIIPDSVTGARLVISPDGNHFASVVQEGIWVRPLRDMKLGPTFTTVQDLVFDRASANLYCLARQGNGWCLVTNFRPGQLYDAANDLNLLPRTGLPVFLARRKAREFLVTAEVEGPHWNQISEVTYTPGESILAYAAADSSGWKIVEGSTVRIAEDAWLVHNLRYREQTREPVYAVIDRTLSSRVKVNGRILSNGFARLDLLSVGPDTGLILYRAGDSSDARIFLGDRALSVPPNVIGGFRFSPDGRKFAFVAVIDADYHCVVVRDSAISPIYDEISDLRFSPKQGRLVFSARRGNEYFVVQDTTAGPSYDGVGYLRFAPETDWLAYLAARGDQVAEVAAGREGKFYDDIGGVQFSPDGRRIAYAAKQGNDFFWVTTAIEPER